MFDYRKDFGYLETVAICQLVGCWFRSQCSLELGFVCEEDLEQDDELSFDVIRSVLQP
jgi:hypothetical protein